ncbi:MAG: XTP/dITP diphosphatase [Oscillibacter sp.]|nr:XTP/dITP diphosphatase [Oscillibacter sp.]
MSERFVLATHNPGKVREMREILSELGLEVLAPEDVGVTVDVEETGATFAENAMLKAKAICELTGLPAIGDDSGLCVNALNGGPGVYSARYGGADITDEQRNKLLLESVKGQGTRDAHFTCAIVCAFPNGDEITAEGRCDGVISYIPMGTGGFGYDPVFNYPPKLKTFAQMTPEEKSEISHRGKALRAFAEKLGAYLSELAWKELEEEKAQQEPAPEASEDAEESADAAPEVAETPQPVPDENPPSVAARHLPPEGGDTEASASQEDAAPEVTESAEESPDAAPEASESAEESPDAAPEVSEDAEKSPDADAVTEEADAVETPESVTETTPEVTEGAEESADAAPDNAEASEDAETPDGAEHHPHKKKRKRKKHH